MRLRHLYLHGFKTFAPRTDLAFGEGLTAIVGPNGSGKSNIADAVRWVLGEQSLSNLRAKRTEDLIFAGSANRAPLGMAEVSITVDNSDRLLPLDFSEVTLTRRAYRSGENEYYVNKSRVRLRDVLEVASTLGQAYTVVGQGLVDAALSLRPEERRELFEEAAAIRGYFVQREDALKRLGKTEENIARVNDLASELEPQVRRMERQARQAQEYKKIQGDLDQLLQVWYRSRWRAAVESLLKAQKNEERAVADVQMRKAALAGKTAELGEARAAAWQLVDSVSKLNEQRAQGQARHAAKSQAQAVLAERHSAAGVQRQALEREEQALDAGSKSGAAQLAEVEAEIARHRATMHSLQEEGQEVARRLPDIDRKLNDAQETYRRETAQLDGLTRRQSDLQARMTDAERRRAEQERALVDTEASLAELRRRLQAEEATLAERHEALLAAQRDVSDAEHTHLAVQQSVGTARVAQNAAESERREASKRMDGLAAQLGALAGEQQASLYAGVQAVVSAARQDKLTGYVGTVAELLQVPMELEIAIEAALGGRLQEVVVQSWADAERAISMLKASGLGRATFLPLDTLRSGPPMSAPKGPGIIGVARDLVTYEPYLKTLAESLLGRLLIVEDLQAARKTLSAMQASAPWTLATLGGEVVRPGGSVTGGSHTRADDSRAKGRTILGRERRRRELAAAHEKALADLEGKEEAVERAHAVVRERESELALATGRTEETRKEHALAQLAHVEQGSVVARLHQEVSWRNGLRAETHKNIEHLTLQLAEMAAQQVEVEALIGPQQASVHEHSQRLEELRRAREKIAASAGDGQTRLAVVAETLRNLGAKELEIREEGSRLEARRRDVAQRLKESTEEEKEFARNLEEQAIEATQLSEELKSIEGQISESERQVRLHEGVVGRIETEQTALQAALLDAETMHSRASVEKQRCIGTLDSLRVEIIEEVGGGAEQTEGLGVTIAVHEGSEELPWPVSKDSERERDAPTEAVAADDLDPEQSADLERRIYSLRARLSRLGPVNPLAMEEHASLSERHDYLQSQLTDLSGAAEALRRVIDELDRTMREQFAATFEQVNQAFQHFFSTLFGGGVARLELTNPQDVSASGVEIFAQPPGKRMQPLAALSGGERALTSAALLFALLRVRPVPFCVLDEVDAALDESNVTRFRSALQELGQKTQFVVITHNRGTIEAADTLYGISMAGDGTSQMLSLKVEAVA